jgi:hypothetical protein
MEEQTAKRKITPHKGGRTKRLPNILITPETAAQIAAIQKHRGIARFGWGDWIAEKIAEEFAKIPKEEKA